MNIKLELIQSYIIDLVKTVLEDTNFQASEIADTTAISALSEIKSIISDENLSDFDAVEEIVCVLESYGIDVGSRHDF